MAGEGVGIPQLDALLQTIPRAASIVLLNDPGVEADVFLDHAAGSHLAQGRRVVFVTLTRAPSTILRSIRAYGFEPDPRPVFVDGFSALVGGDGDTAYRLPDPRDLDAIVSLLRRTADEHPGAVLLVDSLSTLADHASPAALQAKLPDLVAACKRFELSLLLFTRWPYEEPLAPLLAPFDAVVGLRAVEERILVSQSMSVERAAWPDALRGRARLYKAMRPGGVLVYVPKIVVTGPYHAGKSTFIKSVSDVATSVNKLGTTVALDHGQVTMAGLTADLFGTPGQERFDPILKRVASQALGVVLVIDSTAPETVPRARDIMDLTWRKGLPLIVAANKQDLPGAVGVDEIRALLAAPPEVRVVACLASDPASSRRVLQELLGQILLGEVQA